MPPGWGSGLRRALSSGSETRKYHLRRRFTPSRPDVGCEFRGGEWARQQHASAASSSASTSSSRGGGDTRRAPQKWLGPDNSRPRASRTLLPAGTAGGAGQGGGDRAAALGWGSECAGLGGGLFPGRWGGGRGAFLSLWWRVWALTFSAAASRGWRSCPFPPFPPPHEEASGVRDRPRLAPPLPSPLLVRGEGDGTCCLGPNLHNPSSSLALSAFSLGPDARPGARTHVTLREKP